jgi:hypothetical protein
MYRESTSAGAGIFQSEDGGNTWQQLPGTVDFAYVNDIVIREESGGSVIYAAVGSGVYQGKNFGSLPSDGLYQSKDNGDTWRQVFPLIEDSSVPYMISDIELTASGRLLAATMRNLENKGGGKIFQSEDGENWEMIFQYENADDEVFPGRVKLAPHPSVDTVMYAMATGGLINELGNIRDQQDFTVIYASFNGGQSWQEIPGPNAGWANIPWHAMALAVDPNDPFKLVIGALDTYVMNNTRTGQALDWIKVSNWISMYGFSEKLANYYGLQVADSSLLQQYVHADIHQISFLDGNSDEILLATDGGIQYTRELTRTNSIINSDVPDLLPRFSSLSKNLTTTQYYTVALSENQNPYQIMGGTQDNSTQEISPSLPLTLGNLIGGGDGAYCFFDGDDPALRITSSQANGYNIWIGEQASFASLEGGSFINPGVYDDRANLLYVNKAVDGGFEVLTPELLGQFLDELAVLNLNQVLGKSVVALPPRSSITLGTGSQAAFSALQLSKYSPATNATMVLGNQLGDVYLVKGLPINPQASKIDRDQLPVGYISAVDFGASEDQILVTVSNYGIPSVWYTSNAGQNWTNLERNLPDIPVRYGIFHPEDATKILIATEVGVWGLENLLDESSTWQHYQEGFPNVRVDMIKMRASDSTIVAATHGRGIFQGKVDMGPSNAYLLLDITEKSVLSLYPNPADHYFQIQGHQMSGKVVLKDLQGRVLRSWKQAEDQYPIGDLKEGIYLVCIQVADGSTQWVRLVKR